MNINMAQNHKLCNKPKMAAFPNIFLLYALLVFSVSIQTFGSGCYKSIISFGDSLADTGNLMSLTSSNNHRLRFFLPPYGKTFFHYPNGRCSDGRLVIDFIAESLGLPLVSPYFEKSVQRRDIGEGVNFAVAGATALEDSFFLERGIDIHFVNVSMANQIHWFREMLASLCQKPSDCKQLLRGSLILMGEIGGNDYNRPMLHFEGSMEVVRTFVPEVVRAIASAIVELIELGAETLIVPGNLPIGCSVAYLTHFQSSNKKDYDSSGCLKWLNEFSKYHNQILQNELNRLRKIHPYVNIIYADYYNAAATIYRSPQKFGFKWALSACCGNASMLCGNQPTTCCDDPSLYVSWDGLHLTEAAYKWIAKGLIQGPYTNPPLNTICNIYLPSANLEIVS